MGDLREKPIPPDSVAVAHKRLKVELPEKTVEEVIKFTAPVDARATEDLTLADQVSKREATK